ncbi:MAG TPA: IS110 family transposase [Lactobacillus sp.]|nr:IS110 family transposase [Lactobacillus sp.]
MIYTNIVGVDVSKGKSAVAILSNGVCVHRFTFTHTKTGFQTLKHYLIKLSQPIIYFEATGIYSRPIQTFCECEQVPYVQLNPLSLYFQTSDLRRLKTDRTDALKIAQNALKYPHEPTHQFAPIYVRLRELTRFHEQVDDDIKLMRSKLHVALQQTFPELEYLFASRVSKLTLNIIELFPHPDYVVGQSRTKLKHTLIRQTDKKISDTKALRRAEELIRYAKLSYPAVSANSVQVDEVRYYARQIKMLLENKADLVKQLVETAKKVREFELFVSFPGIGDLSAAEIIGESGDLRRFDNANQINAYVGIDINRYQSGTYTRTDHINKRGNAHLRMILFFTVKNMIRQQAVAKNHIVDYYYRLKKGPHPKRDKVATVACMNKLIYCLYAMVQHHRKYDYAPHHGL